MASFKKKGCKLEDPHRAGGSQTCEAEECWTCSDGTSERGADVGDAPKMRNMAPELEQDKEAAPGCADSCELDGVYISSGSVVCQSGECGICFKNKWLHPTELH